MKVKLLLQVVVIFVVAVFLGACSRSTGMHTAEADFDAKMAQIQQKEAQLSSMQANLNAREQQLAQEQKRLDEQMRASRATEEKAMTGQQQMAMGGELFPPNAEPGACYARVFVPPVYKTVSQTVLKHEAGEKIEVIPAKYETATERVVAKEAGQKLEVIPAQYDFVEEQVMVKPATQRLVQVPAKYETVSEKILVKPAHTVWKKGTGPIQRIDEATGEIMCLVEVPDEYRTVSKRVLKEPATTKMIEEPAVYKTIKKRVMVKPPTTQVVEIPAEYKTVEVTKLVQPAQEKRIPIPAEYQTVTKRELASEGHMEWREILCDTNMTRDRISQIQSALKQAGYDPGPIDGVIGSSTMAAVNQFQKAKGLVVTNNLTMNTVKALGVHPGR